MADKKVTNLVFMSLSIPELNVLLHGKGSHALINAEAAAQSSTLKEYIRKRWVKIETINKVSMPYWPFYSVPKELPDISHTFSAQPAIPDVKPDVLLSEIRDLLKTFMDRQITSSPSAIPQYVYQAPNPAAPVDDAPKFIPSKIMPEKVEISIKTISHESNRDTDGSLEALRRLKKQ